MYNLLLGGYGSHISYASFDPSTAQIKVHKESPCPDAPSWLDPYVPLPTLKTASGGHAFYSIAEIEKGQAVSLELKGQEVKVTGTLDLKGSPAHVHTLKDGSGIIVANYMGGNAQLVPTTSSHSLDTSSTLKPLYFPYIYKDTTPPNPGRQDTSHPHQIIEGPSGEIYVPDLGCDRIWVVHRDTSSDSGLKIEGYFVAAPGTGPRHGVISKDGKYLYLLGELDQTVSAYPLSASAASTHAQPIFKSNIAPPSVPEKYRKYLGAAELLLSPSFPGTLYASNRLEQHIKESDPSYPGPDSGTEIITGDAIAIVLLDSAGTKVEDTKFVRTSCDHIRGMMYSPDGKYVALAGKDAGGVEIWQVDGARGEKWKLAAKDEALKQVTTFVWL